MTDLETIQNMFDKANIEYDMMHVLDEEESKGYEDGQMNGVIQLSTREEEHKNVLGYYTFYSVHFFDRLGNLLNTGAWE